MQGEEVTFLPPIVDAAESSPAAAAECARLIRKFLHRDYWTKPSYQYNAIMLIRILSDNPGMTFTRNMDKKFVDTAKELLRTGRDPSVRQMLMETLDTFENTKGYDEGLGLIIEMWKKEKEKAYKVYGVRRRSVQPGKNAQAAGGTGTDHRRDGRHLICGCPTLRLSTRIPKTTSPARIATSGCPTRWSLRTG